MAKTKTKKYKLKTHKATAKRFKVTGTGKVMRTQGRHGHFRRRRSNRALSKISKMVVVVNTKQARRISMLAPYLHLYRQNPPA